MKKKRQTSAIECRGIRRPRMATRAQRRDNQYTMLTTTFQHDAICLSHHAKAHIIKHREYTSNFPSRRSTHTQVRMVSGNEIHVRVNTHDEKHSRCRTISMTTTFKHTKHGLRPVELGHQVCRACFFWLRSFHHRFCAAWKCAWVESKTQGNRCNSRIDETSTRTSESGG